MAAPELVRALNGRIEVVLDGAVDPLSVSAGSVRLLRDNGTRIPAQLETAGGRVLVQLVVTPELLSEALTDAWLELSGLPSPQALCTVDGRRLRQPVRRHVELEPMLRSGASEAPRLVGVDGRPPGTELSTVHGTLTLSFLGVLDPASLSPATCPLVPVAGDLRLPKPVQPPVRWRCVGERFDLLLEVPPASGRLQLVLRMFGVRDLSGRAPEPAGFVADLLAP